VAEALAEHLPKVDKPSLDEAGNFYAKAIDSMGNFLGNAGDLALRGAASALGQRGGRASGAKRAAKKIAATVNPPSACPLCKDPSFRFVTVPMIQAHRSHENGQPVSAAVDAPVGLRGSGPDVPEHSPSGQNGNQ